MLEAGVESLKYVKTECIGDNKMSDGCPITCYFSGESAEEKEFFQESLFKIESPACGTYWITETARSIIQNRISKDPGIIDQGLVNCGRRSLEVKRESRRNYSLWASRKFSAPTPPKDNLIVCYLEDFFAAPVDHSIKPFILLEEIGRGLSNTRAFMDFVITPESRVWARIVDRQELAIIVNFLWSNGFLETDVPLNEFPGLESNIHNWNFRVTVSGWDILRKGNISFHSNQVFIATAFDWPNEDAERIQTISSIQKACSSLGYEANTVSQDHTDNITDRILAEIRRSRFVVAELTYHNRGVYFEAGYAKGLGIPVYFVVKEGFTSQNPLDDRNGKRIHFDIAQVMYRKWKSPEDLEAQLKDWIEATLGPFSNR